MNRSAVVLPMFLLVVLLAGCSQAPPPDPPDTRAADQAAIKDGETAWVADWKARDLDKIVSHYADDAIVMAPDMPAMKGKDAIRTNMKAMLDDKNFMLTFAPTTVEASRSGDLAYVYGTYTASQTDAKTKKPVSENGKYASVYRKQADGTWKAIVDIVNADAPAK